MVTATVSWVQVVLFSLSFWTQAAAGQESSWEKYFLDGAERTQKGLLVLAKQIYLSALREAEKLGEGDTRLALTLDSLAKLLEKPGSFRRGSASPPAVTGHPGTKLWA